MARELERSERRSPLHCLEESATGPWPDDWPCDVTLYLRAGNHRGLVQGAASHHMQQRLAGRSDVSHLSREELATLVEPDAEDRDKVVSAFRDADIDHVHAVGMRAVHVQATWGALSRLVSVQRRRYRTRDGVVVGRAGPIRLEHPDLDPVVAVFGLDNRRALSPYVIKSHVIKSHVIKSHVIKSHGDLAAEWAQTTGQTRTWFTPEDVAAWYDFPPGTGEGGHVGVLAFSGQLGGTDQLVTGGYDKEALDTFFGRELGLSPLPSIAAHRIRGPGNWPGDGSDPSDFTDEVMLDLSVVGALAPGARITVYFSEPTEQGFVDALHHVVEQYDLPDVLLVCYGSPEDGGVGTSWTRAAMEQSDEALAAAALRGMTVVCSCGDNGAAGAPLSTRVHADFPAASPWVLGCGGTSADRSDQAAEPETVWNDGTGASGGGVSAVVPRPGWQSTADVPAPVDAWRRPGWEGRGVPDVAAIADPATGVAVVDAQGNTVSAGGTSVSAPIWAALLLRCGEQANGRLGLVTPAIYASRTGLRDVAVGDNGAYAAVRGAWDPCTGWGVPDGRAFRDALLRGVSPAGSAERASAPDPA